MDPSARQQTAELDRRSAVLVGAGTALFWTSLYLYVPILPLHAEKLGSSLAMVGLIVSSYALAQVALRIPVGVAADIVGRRKPFAAGALACSTLGALGLAVAPDPWTLFAARALTGVAATGWVAISVLFSSYFRADRMGHAMARLMSINTASLVAATFTGGLISDKFGAEASFYAGVGTAALGMILMLAAREPPLKRESSYSTATFLRVARTPLLLLAGGIGILLQFVTFAGPFGFVPLYAERMGATDAEVGYVTTAMLVAAVLGTLAVTRIVAVCGNRYTLLFGCTIGAVSMVLMPAASAVWGLIALQAIGGFARGVVNTALISLSLHAVSPEDRATGMGIYQAVYAIGMVGGPLVSGYLAEAVALEAVFYLAAAVSLVAGFVGLARTIPTGKAAGADTVGS